MNIKKITPEKQTRLILCPREIAVVSTVKHTRRSQTRHPKHRSLICMPVTLPTAAHLTPHPSPLPQNKWMYILDDILSSVDPPVALHIMRHCVHNLLAGRTVLLTSPVLPVLARVDWVLRMAGGRVVMQGECGGRRKKGRVRERSGKIEVWVRQ